MLIRKERWGLSWRGWLIVVSVPLLAGSGLLVTVQPFLSVTHRVEANVLVVEGWVHEYAIRAGAEEFRSGPYQYVYTTGGPVTGSGGYASIAETSASVGAGQLRNAGIPPECVQMVPSQLVGRDRTYNSAVALRDWFRDRKMLVSSLNVVTENTHARRTRLLFQEAFGKVVKVGVIAVPNPDYDAKYWWRCSDGVREVVGETIAYLYAKLFFHPSEPKGNLEAQR